MILDSDEVVLMYTTSKCKQKKEKKMVLTDERRQNILNALVEGMPNLPKDVPAEQAITDLVVKAIEKPLKRGRKTKTSVTSENTSVAS